MSEDPNELDALLAEASGLQKDLGFVQMRRSDLAKPEEQRRTRRRPPRMTELAREEEEPTDASAAGLADDRINIQLGPTGPQSSPGLEQPFIDPPDLPFTPEPRPGRSLPSRVFSLLVMGALLVMIGWLVLPEVQFRFAHLHHLSYENAILTAQPVPLGPVEPALVEEIYIKADNTPDLPIPANTPIARLQTSLEDGTTRSHELVVPFDARFVSIDTPVGATTRQGVSVATVYDPAEMYLIVTVPPDDLDEMRAGMRATLTAGHLDAPVLGTVISAVPLLGNEHEPTSRNLVNIRVRPDEGAVVNLVPGLRFDVAIDLRSAPEGAQPLVIVGALDETPAVLPADDGR
jgi:hypothetical protein